MTKITDSDLLKKMEEALGHDLEVHGINPTYFIGNNDMEVFYTDGKSYIDGGHIDKGGENGTCSKGKDVKWPWIVNI